MRTLLIIVGVMGFITLLGLHIDIQSNLSTKLALRKRSKQIEELLSPEIGAGGSAPLRIWRDTIPNRVKYLEENRLKRLFAKALPERESNYFVWTYRLALGLWVTLVVLVVIYGPRIAPVAELFP